MFAFADKAWKTAIVVFRSLGATLQKVADAGQASSQHNKDLRDAINQAGEAAKKNKGEIDTFGNILDKISGLRYAVSSVVGAVVGATTVRAFKEIQSQAVGLELQLGDTSHAGKLMAKEIMDLSYQSRLGSDVLAEAAGVVLKYTHTWDDFSKRAVVWAGKFSEVMQAMGYSVSPEV